MVRCLCLWHQLVCSVSDTLEDPPPPLVPGSHERDDVDAILKRGGNHTHIGFTWNYARVTSVYARIMLTAHNYSLCLVLCSPNRRSPSHEVLLPDCYPLLSIFIAGHDSNSFNHSDWILYSRGECKKTHTHKLVVLPLGMFQGGYRITLTHHQGKEELNDSFMTTTAEDYER